MQLPTDWSQINPQLSLPHHLFALPIPCSSSHPSPCYISLAGIPPFPSLIPPLSPPHPPLQAHLLCLVCLHLQTCRPVDPIFVFFLLDQPIETSFITNGLRPILSVHWGNPGKTALSAIEPGKPEWKAASKK